VHGIKLPEGLVESQKLPDGFFPLFTPSTKAEQGAHDQNISPDSAKELIGESLYNQISATAIALFKKASSYAAARGLILADTKFEFGLVSTADPSFAKQLILIDEVLTPDSSRYWPSEGYKAGKPQPSFDKQFLRNWLTGVGFKKGLEAGKDGKGWVVDEEIVIKTKEKYDEAVRMLTSTDAKRADL